MMIYHHIYHSLVCNNNITNYQAGADLIEILEEHVKIEEMIEMLQKREVRTEEEQIKLKDSCKTK